MKNPCVECWTRIRINGGGLKPRHNCGNGLCLECSREAMHSRPMLSERGRDLARRFGELTGRPVGQAAVAVPAARMVAMGTALRPERPGPRGEPPAPPQSPFSKAVPLPRRQPDLFE